MLTTLTLFLFSWLAFLPLAHGEAFLPIEETSFVLYRCEATSSRSYEGEPEGEGEPLGLNIVRITGAPSLLAFVNQPEEASGRGRRRDRVLKLFEEEEILGHFGFENRRESLLPRDPLGLDGPGRTTFYSWPEADDNFRPREHEAISFPADFELGHGSRPLTVFVKLVRGEGNASAPRRLYRAECAPTKLNQGEYSSWEAFTKAPRAEDSLALHREAAPAASFFEAFANYPIYSAHGELLHAAPAAVAGTATGLAIAAAQAGRFLAKLLARGPAAAAFVLPQEGGPALHLDLAATGLSLAEGRAFFAATPAEQRSHCVENPAYRQLCRGLAELAHDLARREGRAF